LAFELASSPLPRKEARVSTFVRRCIFVGGGCVCVCGARRPLHIPPPYVADCSSSLNRAHDRPRQKSACAKFQARTSPVFGALSRSFNPARKPRWGVAMTLRNALVISLALDRPCRLLVAAGPRGYYQLRGIMTASSLHAAVSPRNAWYSWPFGVRVL